MDVDGTAGYRQLEDLFNNAGLYGLVTSFRLLAGGGMRSRARQRALLQIYPTRPSPQENKPHTSRKTAFTVHAPKHISPSNLSISE